MDRAGIRDLKQNASVVVAAAASGQTVVITDRGRPVAQLTPYGETPMARLRAAGRVREAAVRLADLPAPETAPGPSLSETLDEMRGEERP